MYVKQTVNTHKPAQKQQKRQTITTAFTSYALQVKICGEFKCFCDHAKTIQQAPQIMARKKGFRTSELSSA